MKTKFVLLAYILTTVSCSAQKGFIKTNRICLFDNPIFEISESERIFDGKKYDSILNLKGVIFEDLDKYIYEIQPNTIGVTDKETKLTKWINYRDSKKIESVSFFIRNSSSTKIDKEYYFNDNGEIIETIDYEKGYNICWAEAIAIIKKIARKDIKKYKIDEFSLNRTDINEFPDEKPKWILSMTGEIEDEYINDRYVIDGFTGELIRKYKVNVIYDDVD